MRIREVRETAGISQRQLAARACRRKKTSGRPNLNPKAAQKALRKLS